MTRVTRVLIVTLLAGVLLALSVDVASAAPRQPDGRLAARVVLLKKFARVGPRRIERGIVQSVGNGSIVLRELDGSAVTLAVVPQTQILVNRQPATLADVQVGFVAQVLLFGNGPAVSITAVGVVRPQRDRGVVQSVGAASLVLVTASGPVTIAVGPSTLIQLNGHPAALSDLRAGDVAAAVHTGSSPASEIRAVGRRAH
jgi:hypothetical protein